MTLLFGLILLALGACLIVFGAGMIIAEVYTRLNGPGEDPYDYPEYL